MSRTAHRFSSLNGVVTSSGRGKGGAMTGTSGHPIRVGGSWRRRGVALVAASVALTLFNPGVRPAVAAEFDPSEIQSMSIEELREYTDSLGFDAQDARMTHTEQVGAEDVAPAPEPAAMPRHDPAPMKPPAPGTDTIDLSTASAKGTAARSADGEGATVQGRAAGQAGGLGIGLRAASQDGASAQIKVTHHGRNLAEKIGAVGPVLTLEPSSGPRGKANAPGRTEIDLDVSHLAAAGGGLLHRLRLVELPACAATTPQAPECQEPTPVEGSTVDVDPQEHTARISGVVDLAAAGDSEEPAPARSQSADAASPSSSTMLAVAADTSGSAGDWGATSLAPSSSWNVSTQTGAFSWSYPLRTPPAAGGLAPKMSLSYSSASLDGRVVSANSQASQVGDGWKANVSGYVERKYVSCSEDQDAVDGQDPNNANRKTGDQCWKSNNATLVFNGSSSELVRDGSSNVWRPENDNNMRVERKTGGSSGVRDGEYWVVTTPDGTRYTFGAGLTNSGDPANSVQYGRVYGNHPGEPCHAATFADSSCAKMPYRWNLDLVEDVSGNTMSYKYRQAVNRYEHNIDSGTTSYTRAARLDWIEYGTRAGSDAAAPARVTFGYSERCIPDSSFDCAPDKLDEDTSSHWPDVPQDLICDSTTSCDPTSPAFFDRWRLTSITTQIRQDGSWAPVDSWKLTQSYPDPGDGSDPALWLESIQHTGHGGTTTSSDDKTLPAVTFHGVQLDNRVDTTGDMGPAMTRFRIDRIRSESGGITAIAYSPQECTINNLPSSPQANEKRCQPVYWTPQGNPERVLEYFHHYRVTSVTQDPRIHGTVPIDTEYRYTGSPAWHYDDNELVTKKYRTWGQLRGYSRVDVFTGQSGEAGQPRLHTGLRYFRGMHGDRNGSGGTRDVAVDGIDDLDEYSGMVREKKTYAGSTVTEQTVNTPWRSSATAVDPDDGSKKAFHTGTKRTDTITPLSAGGTRGVRSDTTFDSYGMPTTVSRSGDVGAGGDESCTRTTYNRNTSKNILSTVQRTETVAVRCDQAASRPGDVISDVRYAYDSQGVGGTPTRGRVTLQQELDSYSGGSRNYVDVTTTRYNNYGQPIRVTDALGNTTTIQYDNTAGGGGLTRSSTATTADPDGSGPREPHTSVTEVNPAWGTPTKATDPNGKATRGTYDALGRLTQVWEPGRTTSEKPTSKFTYAVDSSGLNSVVTESLNWDASGYVSSSVIYDGLLRERQTQAPSASASTSARVISETFFDTRGLKDVTRDGWSTSGSAVGQLAISEKAVDSRTVWKHDGAGRVVSETFQTGEGDAPDDGASYLETWTTTTSYDGERVNVDPPTGGTPSTTVMDAHGRVAELWEYEGASPSGSHHVTEYTYDAADRLTAVVDPAGNQWSYEFDLRGRQVAASDPDKGDSTTTFDEAGNVVSTTDARGETIAYTYDDLNRRTSMREGSTTGPVRASWTFDLLGDGSLVKGQQTASTRHHDTGNGTVELTTSIDEFTDRYEPVSTTVSIPESAATPAGIAGEYTYEYTYTQRGQVSTQILPGVGPIATEGMTIYYSDENGGVADGLTGGFGWGTYVNRADYLPTGELSYLRTGTTYAYQESLYYQAGTRRLEGVTTTQQTGREDDQLHELRHASYEYDDAGNLLGVSDTPDPALGAQPSDRQCFEYDWARRLTEAWTPGSASCSTAPDVSELGGAEPYWKSYAYDDATGVRTGSTLHRATSDGGDVTSTYTYPSAGSARPHAVSTVTATDAGGSGLGESSYSWDGAGNLTGRQPAGKPVQELEWDIEGELASVAQDTDGDGTVGSGEQSAADGYVYTAGGDRLLRTQGGATTLYLPGQEITVTADGEVSAKRYYTFAGQTVAVRDNGSRSSDVSTIFNDHHGTGLIQVANTTNQVTRRHTDPFGGARDEIAGVDPKEDPAGGQAAHGDGQPDDWVGDRGFLDKPADATGLTAVGARMYDPSLGTFVSVDPVMDLTDPQQWNAYAYSNNNPTTWSDPTGLLFNECHDGSHDCTVGRNGNIDVERNWDRCERGAIACVTKKKPKDGPPVTVRECYTAYACETYKNQDQDPYTKASGTPVTLVDKTVDWTKRAAQIAAQHAAQEAREAARDRREQESGWLNSVGNWWSEHGETSLSGVATGLGLLTPICPVCGAVGAVISLGLAIYDVTQGDYTGAVINLTSAVTFGAAGSLAKGSRMAIKARDGMWKARNAAKASGQPHISYKGANTITKNLQKASSAMGRASHAAASAFHPYGGVSGGLVAAGATANVADTIGRG